MLGCGAGRNGIGIDGTLPMATEYRSWPNLLVDIPKGEPRRMRDICIDPPGARTSTSQSFTNGTVIVMEIYSVAPATRH